MKKTPRRLALLGTFAAIVVLATPAPAICGAARLFASLSLATADYSYIYTPGFDYVVDGSSVSPNLTGTFHTIGDGDPQLLMGNDNGGFPAIEGSFPSAYSGWARAYANYPVSINSTWAADARIDGCPDVATPTGNLCMAIVLSDQDANGQGYFALLTDAADTGANYNFALPRSAAITLAPIPRPNITGTVRLDGQSFLVNLAGVGVLGSGVYLDQDCADATVGYKTYRRALPRGAAPPIGREISAWTEASGATEALGSSSSIGVICSGNEDIYLTHSIVFDSGFETAFVSSNSSRIECGPIVAEPIQQRLRPGDRLDPRQRGGKRGR